MHWLARGRLQRPSVSENRGEKPTRWLPRHEKEAQDRSQASVRNLNFLHDTTSPENFNPSGSRFSEFSGIGFLE